MKCLCHGLLIAILTSGPVPALAMESKSAPGYADAIRCSASHLLLHVIHMGDNLLGLAKHHEERMGIWINYAITLNEKSIDAAFADQEKDYDMLAAKFYDGKDDAANDAVISDTVGRCSGLEKQYRNTLNAANGQ